MFYYCTKRDADWPSLWPHDDNLHNGHSEWRWKISQSRMIVAFTLIAMCCVQTQNLTD